MPTIVFALYPNVLHSSITLPAEMLVAANHKAKTLRPSGQPLNIEYVSEGKQPVKTALGTTITPTIELGELTNIDVFFCPSIWRGRPLKSSNFPTLIQTLKRLSEQGTVISAVGTGSQLPALAGLLDHVAATTHWHYMDQFQQQFPKVNLKREHLITQTGNVYCAASLNALADLCCHFIERFFGSIVAQHIEAQFSPEIRRSFTRHGYVDSNPSHSDELMVDIKASLEKNYNTHLNLAVVAKENGISQRTLNRRFKQASGQSPKLFIKQLRVDNGKDMLRDTNLSILRISSAVGYNDATRFSTEFKSLTGQTPSQFRKASRSKTFDTSF